MAEASPRLFAPTVTRHLPAVEEMMRSLAMRHGPGVVGALAQEHLATGGKRLRARLALAAVAALGEDPGRATRWAAACELLHNATLVHDDLQDGDTLRRGVPTVWARHGMPQAVNTGDLLLLLPFLSVAEGNFAPPLGAALHALLAVRGAAVIAGQANEFARTRAGPIDRATYREVVLGKTSGLFEMPIEGAALIAGRSATVAGRLGATAKPLGVVFQLQDDVLDLYGDKGRGRIGSDLSAGRMSALVVEHLARAPADRAWVESLFMPGSEGVATAPERMRRSGALDAVRQLMADERARALALPELETEPALYALIEELFDAMIEPVRAALGD